MLDSTGRRYEQRLRGYALIMNEKTQLLHSGQKTPASGIYECDCGKGHRFSTDVEGHRLPPMPHGCQGRGWRLARATHDAARHS